MSERLANDNSRILYPALDRAIVGQAITIAQPHRRFGRSYAEFVGHVGDGKHILVRKLIAGTYSSRWSKPLKVERSQIISVHQVMAHGQAA